MLAIGLPSMGWATGQDHSEPRVGSRNSPGSSESINLGMIQGTSLASSFTLPQLLLHQTWPVKWHILLFSSLCCPPYFYFCSSSPFSFFYFFTYIPTTSVFPFFLFTPTHVFPFLFYLRSFSLLPRPGIITRLSRGPWTCQSSEGSCKRRTLLTIPPLRRWCQMCASCSGTVLNSIMYVYFPVTLKLS